MGTYGVDYFGDTRFGRDPALIRPDFSVDPFTYNPLDYATLHLTWARPPSTDCTQLQLVRNQWNLPQDETDGVVVFSDLVSRPLSYSDGQAGAGFNYYTMWGWDAANSVWVRCTDLIALLPLRWGYGDRFYSLLPAAYRDQDWVLVDPYNPWVAPALSPGQSYTVQGGDTLASVATLFNTTITALAASNNITDDSDLFIGQVLAIPTNPSVAPTPPLQRFLAMLGFELDFIRTELESLMSVNDAMHCSGALLPLLQYQFGLPNSPRSGCSKNGPWSATLSISTSTRAQAAVSLCSPRCRPVTPWPPRRIRATTCCSPLTTAS